MLRNGALHRFGNERLDDFAIAKVIAGRSPERARALAGQLERQHGGGASLLERMHEGCIEPRRNAHRGQHEKDRASARLEGSGVHVWPRSKEMKQPIERSSL